MIQNLFNSTPGSDDGGLCPCVLLIEPDIDDALQLEQVVNAYYGQSCLRHVQSLDEALSLDLDRFDLALSAMQTADANGLKIIEELLLLRPDIPLIMLAGDHVQADASRAMHEGAYDYVVKVDGYLQTVPVIIEKNLAVHQVKQENARLQVQLTATLGQLRTRNEQLQGLVRDLELIAATDALTGIANRRAVAQTLEKHFAHSLRQDKDLAVIAIDLDGFKNLNDTCGHPAGDRVLMLIARVLTANARASDVPGRIGGDEFIVVLPETDAEEARRVAERIQADFAAAFSDLGMSMRGCGEVTISAGIATRTNTTAVGSTDLLAAADRALYRAKDAGRSRVVIHGEKLPTDSA